VRRRALRRKAVDEWVPTIGRVVALMLIPYAVFVDRGHNPFLFPLITGLYFFKTVYGGGKGEG
jgi:hypothetical protein